MDLFQVENMACSGRVDLSWRRTFRAQDGIGLLLLFVMSQMACAQARNFLRRKVRAYDGRSGCCCCRISRSEVATTLFVDEGPMLGGLSVIYANKPGIEIWST